MGYRQMYKDSIKKSSNGDANNHQSEERFDRELRYQSIMAVTCKLQETGVLDEKDVARAEKIFNEKYNPIYRNPGADK